MSQCCGQRDLWFTKFMHRSPSGHHQASMNDNQSTTTTMGAFQTWLCKASTEVNSINWQSALSHAQLKTLETNTTTSVEEVKTEGFHWDQNPKHRSRRCAEHQKQQLTSEFLGWVVEVARVWLNHTAIIHKSGGTTVIISHSDTIHQNKFKSRPEFTFITVIIHPRIRNATTNTPKHAFFTLTYNKKNLRA